MKSFMTASWADGAVDEIFFWRCFFVFEVFFMQYARILSRSSIHIWVI